MKRLLIGLTLFAAACSGSSPTSPSGPAARETLAQSSANPASGPASGPAADPVPSPTAATVPQFTLSGPSAPNNCVTAGTDPLQWVLNMTDSGPRHLRFVALAHHDDQPGCDPTVRNPRTRIQLSGTTDYAPHTSGQTIMTFDPKMYNCGRVQVDVSIFDAQGNEILIVVLVLNYGSICSPPPNSLNCVPPSQTSAVGLPVSFTATGAVAATRGRLRAARRRAAAARASARATRRLVPTSRR